MGALGGEWVRADLERGEHGVGFADDADDDGALLDCFLRVLDLEDAAVGGAGGVLVVDDVALVFARLTYKVTESLS